MLLACATRLEEALDFADVNRYVPKVLWLYGRRSNRFGLIEHEFRDYAGQLLMIPGPKLASGLPEMRYEQPVVVSSCNLLGMPGSLLVFYLREVSEWSKYWDGYPRRRRIAPEAEHPGPNISDAEQQTAGEMIFSEAGGPAAQREDLR